MKQKKKTRTNTSKSKFNDEFIIGISKSIPTKNTRNKPKKVVKNKTKNKTQKPKVSEKTRRNRIRLIKIFMIIGLFIFAACFLCLSPIFNIREIIVENNEFISSETIQSLSKIEMYKNMFLINRLEVIKNIKKNSYIDSVKVSRVLPDGIKIRVNERTEKYYIEFAEGKYAILDGQGYVLTITSEYKALPGLIGTETTIEELTKNDGNKTRLCDSDLNKLDIVTEILNISKSYEVDTYINRIDITDKDDIKLMLDTEGKIVYLGNCTDLNTRILYMKEIINAEKGKKGELFINDNLSERYPFFRESIY